MSLADAATELDVLIIGGGIAGLWTLDDLTRRGYAAGLVERDALGAGQTIWSQGIIHGGLKYTLTGLMNPSAEAIREMPGVWRECLAGRVQPDLGKASIRSRCCYLWRTDSIASRLGMIGARVGLRVKPVGLADDERPSVLRNCPGDVARLDEQAIDPGSVLAVLSRRNAGRIVRGEVVEVRRRDGSSAHEVRIKAARGERRVLARSIVLTAGNGIAALRALMRLEPGKVQVRPLRMAMLRGPAAGVGALPELFGHCVDGSRTRVTVTSAIDAAGHRVWQIGGEVAEAGVKMTDVREFLAHARSEVEAAIPGLDRSRCSWSLYDAPRAEAATASGRRPDDAVVLVEGAIITAWPTKLALAPRVATLVGEAIERLGIEPSGGAEPQSVHEEEGGAGEIAVAAPPWELVEKWVGEREL